MGSRPRLGPWMVASKIWQPWHEPLSGGSGSRFGSSSDASPGTSVPGTTTSGRSPPGTSSSPRSPPENPEGWRKPAKVARRTAQGKHGPGNDELPPQGPLALIPLRMDCFSSSPDTVERAMPDLDALALKRARSPSPEAAEEQNRLALVPTGGVEPEEGGVSKKKSATVGTAANRSKLGNQVCSLEPCMSSPGEVSMGARGKTLEEGSRLITVTVQQSESWVGGGKKAVSEGGEKDAVGGTAGRGKREGKGTGMEGGGKLQGNRGRGRAMAGGRGGGKRVADQLKCKQPLTAKDGLGAEPPGELIGGGGCSAKGSPNKPKPKGGRGLVLGAGWCCGPDPELGKAEPGLLEGRVLGKPEEGNPVGRGGEDGPDPLFTSGEGSLAEPVARGSPGKGKEVVWGGSRGGRKKSSTGGNRRTDGVGRPGGESPGGVDRENRERSRSPVRARRGETAGEGSSSGSGGGGVDRRVEIHSVCVARIQRALQGGSVEGGGGGEPGGGNPTPGGADQ